MTDEELTRELRKPETPANAFRRGVEEGIVTSVRSALSALAPAGYIMLANDDGVRFVEWFRDAATGLDLPADDYEIRRIQLDNAILKAAEDIRASRTAMENL